MKLSSIKLAALVAGFKLERAEKRGSSPALPRSARTGGLRRPAASHDGSAFGNWQS